MRRIAISTAAGLAAVAVATTLNPAAASAAAPQTGLVFYSTPPTVAVLGVAEADGLCRTFPATANLLVGWSDVTTVVAYGSADCTSVETNLGTLRSFTPGRFRSFRAL